MKTWKHRTTWLRLVIIVLLLAFVSSSCATAHANSITPTPTVTPGNFITRVFTGAHGMQMTYYLFIPIDYDPQIKYPLVLLLHGGDERANVNNPPDQNRDTLLNQDYVRVWGPGIPGSSSRGEQASYPSFIVVPQVDYPQRWVGVPTSQGPYTLATQPTDSLRMAKEIADALQKQYPNIDPHRLYITGISMGAMAPGTQLSAGLAILLLQSLLPGPVIPQRPLASLTCPSGLFMVLVMAKCLYLVRVT